MTLRSDFGRKVGSLNQSSAFGTLPGTGRGSRALKGEKRKEAVLVAQ